MATQAHDKPLTEEQRQAGEEFFFDDVALLQSLKEVVEGPARDRIEYALDRLQQDSLNPLEVPTLIAMLKSSAEEFIAAQFIPTSRFDVALEGASLVTLGMKLLRTLQSEKSVVRALSSFTSRTSAHVGLRGAQHVGGEVAHLASPSGFGTKFKKSVGFADDIGAPLEFRATYDPHKPGFTVVETQTHSVKPSAVANQNRGPPGVRGKVKREQRWMELAEQPNSRLPKEVVDHVSRHKGKRVTSRFGLELAHKPKKSAAQGYDYSEALPKTTADHRGIEHRYLKERSTGTTISIPNKPASGKLQLPKKGSLPE